MTVWTGWLFGRARARPAARTNRSPLDGGQTAPHMAGKVPEIEPDRPSYGGRNNPSYGGHYLYLGGLRCRAGSANLPSLQKIRLHLNRSD